jgi:GntR family transcriptional regulator
MKFVVQTQSEIPVSTQLLNQLSFAIASGLYPPGKKLPSTRQLAMQTGIHRNTASKVYHQLETMGLVETRAGSGIYVTQQGMDPHPRQQVRQAVDQVLQMGCTLPQARELLLDEIDWRIRCSTQVWISVPASDLGSGQLLGQELQPQLGIPLELVPLEELAPVLKKVASGTVLTIRHFLSAVEKVAQPYGIRVVPIEISDYSQELALIGSLPAGHCLGLVSISGAILGVAVSILASLRGDDLLVVPAEADDQEALRRLVRAAQTIISDSASYDRVRAAIREARSHLIRIPQLLRSEAYIKPQSVIKLRQILNLPDPDLVQGEGIQRQG